MMSGRAIWIRDLAIAAKMFEESIYTILKQSNWQGAREDAMKRVGGVSWAASSSSESQSSLGLPREAGPVLAANNRPGMQFHKPAAVIASGGKYIYFPPP